MSSCLCAPWLAVIIPSYRGEKWIHQALDSLASEAAQGIEVVVVDGSPTSATRDIAQSFSNRLRVRVFERQDLESWHSKTNFGVQSAQSAHICWLGVDDIWLPGRASAVRSWIESAPSTPLHLAPGAIIGKRGKKLGVWRCPLTTTGEIESALVIEQLLVQNFIAAPAPIFRRDAWLRCGGLDETLWYTADWDMWLKLATVAPVYFHNEVTIGFRIHAHSLTSVGSHDSADFANQMRIVLERHLPSLGGESREVESAARASIAVNVALASASTGSFRGVSGALLQVARLGPHGIRRYLYASRIVDRVTPRVRAKLTGAF
jgi:hypothetical protein